MNVNTTIITAQQYDEIISSNGHSASDHSVAADHVGEPPMKLVAKPWSEPLLVDGPCHPYTWRLDGNPVDGYMQPGAWKLVNHLWKQQDLAATFADLKHPVYDDQEHTAGVAAFGSLRRAANAFFRKHGLPWRVCIKKKLVSLNPLKNYSKLVSRGPSSARVPPAPPVTTRSNVAKTAVGSRLTARSKSNSFGHRPKGKRT